MPSTHIDGTLRPNLVMEFDNEKGWQFRVQCEVNVADKQAGADLEKQLQSRNPDTLSKAKSTVVGIADKIQGITPLSRRIIREAFDEAIAQAKANPGATG